MNKGNRKHGYSVAKGKEYRAWCAINNRCYSKANKDFFKYGGAGIGVDDAWRKDFSAFFADMGLAPSPKHQLDRIDSTKGYVRGNVRWVLPLLQQRNKRNCFYWYIKGERYESCFEAAKVFGVTATTVSRWVSGATGDGRVQRPRADCWKEPRYPNDVLLSKPKM